MTEERADEVSKRVNDDEGEGRKKHAEYISKKYEPKEAFNNLKWSMYLNGDTTSGLYG